VQNRAEMVNIELATYPQRERYAIGRLQRKLRGDAEIAHYAQQIDTNLAKYIIVEE
jgi:hypothetical protein